MFPKENTRTFMKRRGHRTFSLCDLCHALDSCALAVKGPAGESGPVRHQTRTSFLIVNTTNAVNFYITFTSVQPEKLIS